MENTQENNNATLVQQEVQAAAPAPQHKEKNTAKTALILGIIGTVAGALSLGLIFLIGALTLIGHGGDRYDDDWDDRMENQRIESNYEGRGGMWK